MSKPPDVTREKAQRIVAEVLGPIYYCRKSTKTRPGFRKQIAQAPKGKIIGEGDTWLDAVIAAAAHLNLPDVLKTAQDLKVAYATPDSVIPAAPVQGGRPSDAG